MKRKMLQVLLHYADTFKPFPELGREAKAATSWLLAEGFLTPDGEILGVTERGQVFLDALENVPLPVEVTVARWEMPR